MGNRDDTNLVVLNTIENGIRKTAKRQHARVVGGLRTHVGKAAQQSERLLKRVRKVIRRYVRTLANIPVDSSIGVVLCKFAKTDPHQLWLRQLSAELCHDLVSGNPLHPSRVHVRNTARNFVIPCLRDCFGRILSIAVKADDKAVNQLTTLVRRQSQRLLFEFFQYCPHDGFRDDYAHNRW